MTRLNAGGQAGREPGAKFVEGIYSSVRIHFSRPTMLVHMSLRAELGVPEPNLTFELHIIHIYASLRALMGSPGETELPSPSMRCYASSSFCASAQQGTGGRRKRAPWTRQSSRN